MPAGTKLSMVMLLLLVEVYLLAAPANSAPVKESTIDKRRESTKETIELEETLKRLAGEDKKYFSNSMVAPMPQIDGLEGSGDLGGELKPQEAESIIGNVHPLEEQLAEKEEEAELQDLPDLAAEMGAHSQYPIPGPYGPGLEMTHGVGVEYEPSYPHEDEEEEEEAEEDEEYFMERVMETLRRHPEMLSELMQGEGEEEDQGDRIEEDLNAIQQRPNDSVDEHDLRNLADYEDRVEEIQAELAAIRSENDRLEANTENRQDDIEALNHYFDKYASVEGLNQVDVPIM